MPTLADRGAAALRCEARASTSSPCNPHQIEAALFALQSPLSKGVILADEVGLGKTIEDSFIVSNTPSHVMRKQWGIEKPEMVRRHILFQDEDKDSYIGATLLGVAGAGT